MVAPSVLLRRSSHRAEFRRCLTDWLIRKQNQTQLMVDACMLLLEELYLLSLPLPPRVVLAAVPGPRNFRFLFRRHVASLLGWTERREEGEYHGFSDSVNKSVREIWWPDEGAEALHRPKQCNRQSRELKAAATWEPKLPLISSCYSEAQSFLQVDWCGNALSWVRVAQFCCISLWRDCVLHQYRRKAVLARWRRMETEVQQGLQRKSLQGSGVLHLHQDDEGASMDLLLEALRDDSICNLDSIATSNFELMWASSSLPTSTRNVTLRSDTSKNLLTPLYDLGCLG